MRKKYTKSELLILLEEHKEYITSTLDWEQYRKKKGLPHYQTLISHFGSWNDLKSLLGLKLNEQNRPRKYTDEELLHLLNKYKAHYTSASEWDLFADKHELPKHSLFYERLGLDVLGEFIGKKVSWNKNNIEETILNYFPEHPPTTTEWNELRKTKQIPTTMTIIRKYGTWNQMKEDVYAK